MDEIRAQEAPTRNEPGSDAGPELECLHGERRHDGHSDESLHRREEVPCHTHRENGGSEADSDDNPENLQHAE